MIRSQRFFFTREFIQEQAPIAQTTRGLLRHALVSVSQAEGVPPEALAFSGIRETLLQATPPCGGLLLAASAFWKRPFSWKRELKFICMRM